MKGEAKMFIDLSGQLVGSLSDNVPDVTHAMIGDSLPGDIDDDGSPMLHSKQFEGTVIVYTDREGNFAGFTVSGLIPKEER